MQALLPADGIVGSRWRPAVWRLLTSTLLVGVDIALGPLSNFVVAKPGKSLRVHVRDLAVIARSRPVDALLAAQPAAAPALDTLLRDAGLARDAVRVVPLVARRAGEWTTVVAAADARVVGHLPFVPPRR